MSRCFLLAIGALLAASVAAEPNTPVAGPAAATTRPRPKRIPRSHLAQPGFTGSAHDFYGPTVPLETRCAPCHAAPLPTSQPQRWITRATPRRLVTASPPRRLTGSSILCLSCHDGTIASEVVGGGQDADLFAFDAPVNPPRDHPVGVPYPPLGRDPQRLRRQYAPIARLQAEGAIKFPEGRVECISCHDPHNALGVPSMLVKSDRRSALCLTCHLK